MKIIYMDNAATTPVSKEVAEFMKEIMVNEFGNPSSQHEMGEKARKIIDDARQRIAKEINCKPWEIVFTSGASEANNMALIGIAGSELASKKKKIIISKIEHDSVYEPCLELKKRGFEVIEISVDKEGFIDLNELIKEVDSKTLIVSIIYGNNEIGTIQDIYRIVEICKRNGVLFHTDAVQVFGKEKIDVKKMNVDLLSASAHKIGGSKGVGFLYIKEGINIKPIILGGGQERGLRSGTENVSGVAGFGKALEIIKRKDFEKIRKIRDYFIKEIEKIGGRLNGSKENRLTNNVNASFNCDGNMLVIYLSQKGIMCSTGSACHEKQEKENRILKAIGLSDKEARGTVRFSIGFDISKKEIDKVVDEIRRFLKR